MDQIFYKGEIGRAISQTTGFDWTGASAKQVLIQKPAGTKITITGTDVVVDDAPTGQIHVLMTSSFDETGDYLLQACATVSGVVRFGPLMRFVVESVISA